MAEIDKKIHWMEVRIQADGELAEALAEVLGRFVSGGVVVESVTKFNAHNQENEPTGDAVVSGYLALDETLESKQQKIEQALWHLGQITPIPNPQYKPIKDQDWMSAWKENYNPIRVGEKFLVVPAWHKLNKPIDQKVIRINPAMAFGTGTHPTTQLCMRLLEKHIEPSIAVIDVGCGSGILSIAALQMGAGRVLAVDVDSQAIISTLENASINSIPSHKLEAAKGSVKEILSGDYAIQKAPLVMVNILAGVIIRLIEGGLSYIVQDEGTLLLSGILLHQEHEVLESAEKAGFVLIERLTDADWVSFALRKKGKE